jgi:hypothetical protein
LYVGSAIVCNSGDSTSGGPIPSDAWLDGVNRQLRDQGIHPAARPWKAIAAYQAETGSIVLSPGPIDRRIFDWFARHTKAGVQAVGPMFSGAFYFDGVFWPLTVPIFCGTVELQPEGALPTMQLAMLAQLLADADRASEFIAVWANSLDYAMSLDDLRGVQFVADARDFLDSGERHVHAASHLLLDRNPSGAASEASALGLEMTAKWFLSIYCGLPSEVLRRDFGHDLKKLLRRCEPLLPPGSLRNHLEDVGRFPSMAARYGRDEATPVQLWETYRTALTVAAILLRVRTGRSLAMAGEGESNK